MTNTTELRNCCNHNCYKTHCARHWKRHKDENAINMNPYDEFKCKHYAPSFARRRKEQCVQIEGFKENNTKGRKR